MRLPIQILVHHKLFESKPFIRSSCKKGSKSLSQGVETSDNLEPNLEMVEGRGHLIVHCHGKTLWQSVKEKNIKTKNVYTLLPSRLQDGSASLF